RVLFRSRRLRVRGGRRQHSQHHTERQRHEASCACHDVRSVCPKEAAHRVTSRGRMPSMKSLWWCVVGSSRSKSSAPSMKTFSAFVYTLKGSQIGRAHV